MSTRTPTNVFDSNVGRGSTTPLVTIFQTRAPTGRDINYLQGQRWIFENPALSAAITAIPNSASGGPTVITANNFFTPGMLVTINSVGGMTQINGGSYYVIDSTPSTFTIALDSSAFSAYTSGGTAVAQKALEYVLESVTTTGGYAEANWVLLATEPETALFLEGNDGIVVPPNGADIIFVLGDATHITTVGNAATNTLTIEGIGTGLTETLTGNSGGAVGPTAFNINTLGAGSITIVGNPGTSTLTTQLTGLTNHAILLGQGTTTIGLLGPTNNATLATTAAGIPQLLSMAADGDLLIGSSIGAPVVGTLTAGTGISITNGHNSITIATAGIVAVSFPTDSGTATPSAGVLNIIAGIPSPLTASSSGCGATVQFNGSGHTVELFLTDSNANTIIGNGATFVGTSNTALGSGASIGNSNSVVIGQSAQGLNGGSVAIGKSASADGDGVAIGQSSSAGFQKAVAVGHTSTAGNESIAIGWTTSANVTNSIAIGYNITVSTNNQIAIGNSSTTTCFLQGVAGVSVSNLNLVTINTSTGQLGSETGGGFAQSFPTDSGTATPSAGALTIKAGVSTQNSGSSVEFTGSGSIVLLNVTDSNSNTIIGKSSGNASLTATNCTAVGFNSLSSLTSGNNNTALGAYTLGSVTTGGENVAIGRNALLNTTTGGLNLAIGTASLQSNVGGGTNIAIRWGALDSCTTPSTNIAIGYLAGQNYTTTESSNIVIGNNGVLADNNTIRIGTQGSGGGQQNLCYISGIAGATVSAGSPTFGAVIIDTSDSQLLSATTGISTAGFVLTSNGTATAPTWQATGASSAIDQINGDSGHITPTAGVVTIYANQAGANCGASVKFVNSGSTSTLNVSDTINNTTIGVNAGATGITGAGANASLGDNTLYYTTTGFYNCALGHSAGSAIQTGSYNIAIGQSSLATGQVITGSYNIAIGQSAGSGYTTSESSNILLNSPGPPGESNVLRIGSATGTGNQQLNKAFVQGITSQTVTGTFVGIVPATGQLGAGGILTNTAQPCFELTYSGAHTNVTGDATQYTVVFDAVTFDQGSNTSADTTFTAPVTGNYFFASSVAFANLGAGHTNGALTIAKNGSEFRVLNEANYFAESTGGFVIVNGSCILNLSASDTVTVSVYVAGSTKTVSVGISDNRSTYFTGYLIC